MRVALICNDDATTNKIFAPIFAIEAVDVAAVFFIASPHRKSGSNITGAFRLFKKMDFSYWLYLVFTNGIFKIFEFLTLHFSASPQHNHMVSLRRLAKLRGITCQKVSDFSDDDFIADIQRLKLDLLIIRVGAKLKPELIDSPREGTWCVHSSVLPACKGIAGEFHSLCDENLPIGSSVFKVTAKLDDGPIIDQIITERAKNQSLFFHMQQNNKNAGSLLNKMLRDKLQDKKMIGDLPGKKLKASYFSWPQKEQMVRFRKKGNKLMTLSEILQSLQTALRL
jgi:methionyl-tRNA formyltransferase